MSEPLIREAAPADAAAINDIYNDAVLASTATFHIQPLTLDERLAWLHEHSATLYPAFVAETDGRIAGWAALSRYATRCAYRFTVEDSIYVARDCRRRGIGAALLRRLLLAAAECRHHSVIAQVADHNRASIMLHEAFGFRTVGELKEVGFKLGHWLDITLMQKMIGPE